MHLFAKQLRKTIKRHRMNDTEFMHHVGLTRGTFNGLLYQDRQPNSITLIKFRKAGINIDYLLLGSGPMLINKPTINERIKALFTK